MEKDKRRYYYCFKNLRCIWIHGFTIGVQFKTGIWFCLCDNNLENTIIGEIDFICKRDNIRAGVCLHWLDRKSMITTINTYYQLPNIFKKCRNKENLVATQNFKTFQPSGDKENKHGGRYSDIVFRLLLDWSLNDYLRNTDTQASLQLNRIITFSYTYHIANIAKVTICSVVRGSTELQQVPSLKFM